jgi:hypothetical protein
MRTSPSIIPNDRLDRDIYLVLEGFRSGTAWRETDEDRVDYATLINDLLAGQYGQPLRVVAFNPVVSLRSRVCRSCRPSPFLQSS